MKKTDLPRREEFLKAALTRFARYGYAATSTREICADLSIVPSAMYNYFPSKEAMILAIEEREMTNMLTELTDIKAQTNRQPGRRLVRLVNYVFSQAIARRESWRLMADMIRSLKPENRAVVIERRDAVERIVRDAIVGASAAGLIPSQDHKLASLHLFSLAEGMSGWYRESGPHDRDIVTMHASEFFLRGLGASSAPLETVRAEFLQNSSV